MIPLPHTLVAITVTTATSAKGQLVVQFWIIADAIGCSVVDLIDPSVSDDNMQKYCPYCGKKLK